MPALPLRSGTPARTGTPTTSNQPETQVKQEPEPHQTPTRASRGLAKQAVIMAEKSEPTAVENAHEAKKSLAHDAGHSKTTDPMTVDAVEPGSRTDELSKQETKEKRIHPGKLDITAAVLKSEQSNTERSSQPDIATPSKSSKSQIGSAVVSAESPVVLAPVKSAPRTLRVVPTRKTETPPPSAVTSALPTPAASTLKFPSRQASVASIPRPGTPSSEQVSISDNVSITSTSMSRANSPPPVGSKVGTAPVRTKTKNQMKKERQERAKVLEEEKAKADENTKPLVGEPAQEAIVSRKKKTKKEKEPKAKPKSPVPTKAGISTSSRPPSPVAKAPIEETGNEEQPAEVNLATTATDPTPQQTPQASREPAPSPPLSLDPAVLIHELKAANPGIQKCLDSLFRTPTTSHTKAGHPISPKDLVGEWKLELTVDLTKHDVDALLRGTVPAVRYGGERGRNWDRGLITPSGAHLRGLLEELEARFLELEKACREMPDDLRFHPSKPQNEIKFEMVDLEALKRQYESCAGRGTHGASAMEKMVQDDSNMKKGAFLLDEASGYINEFVMPPATSPLVPGGVKHECPQHGLLCPTCVHHQPSSAPVPLDANRNHAGLEILERQLQESRKASDERETLLRRAIKKNKKILGMG